MTISLNAIKAIVEGNVLVLKANYFDELRSKEDFFPKDEWGNNALMIAGLNNQLEVAKWLVDNGLFNLSDTNNDGWDVFTLAANSNSLKIIKFLTERFPSDLSHFNKAGFGPFLAAAMGGAESVIEWLLEKKGAVACQNELTLQGKNGLILAAINNHVPVIEKLCMANFNIQASSFQGRTALMEAALNGSVGAISYLIHKQAHLGATDNDGWDAVTLAANQNYLDVIKYIRTNFPEYLTRPNKVGLTPLLAASINGAADVVKFFIEVLPLEELKSEKTREGRNALMLAAINNHVTIIRLLCSAGFSTEITTVEEGRTALMEAAAEGNLEAVKFLTENGANFFAKDKYNFSLFHLAASANQSRIFSYYFSLGQNQNEIKSLLLEKANCGRLPCDMAVDESISLMINSSISSSKLHPLA